MYYLVFLLMKAKIQPQVHGIKKVIFNWKATIYMAYPKFHKAEELSYIQRRNDEWEYEIIK